MSEILPSELVIGFGAVVFVLRDGCPLLSVAQMRQSLLSVDCTVFRMFSQLILLVSSPYSIYGAYELMLKRFFFATDVVILMCISRSSIFWISVIRFGRAVLITITIETPPIPFASLFFVPAWAPAVVAYIV